MEVTKHCLQKKISYVSYILKDKAGNIIFVIVKGQNQYELVHLSIRFDFPLSLSSPLAQYLKEDREKSKLSNFLKQLSTIVFSKCYSHRGKHLYYVD